MWVYVGALSLRRFDRPTREEGFDPRLTSLEFALQGGLRWST